MDLGCFGVFIAFLKCCSEILTSKLTLFSSNQDSSSLTNSASVPDEISAQDLEVCQVSSFTKLIADSVHFLL